MSDDLVERTKRTGRLYFDGVAGEKPFELWRAFDKDLGKDCPCSSPASYMPGRKFRIPRGNW